MVADKPKPTRTQCPRGERWNWLISSGIASSLGNESNPPMDSAQDTGAQPIPIKPSATRATGNAPAGEATTRRNNGRSSAGTIAGSSESAHKITRMAVAEVDHGSDIAVARARRSATSEV